LNIWIRKNFALKKHEKVQSQNIRFQ